MSELLLAIDQGTTSSRAILFEKDGSIRSTGQQEFPQHFPADGWVEHDPEDIWQSTLATIEEAVKGLESSDALAAVGITNQRETTLVWDRNTGELTGRLSAGSWNRRSVRNYARQPAAGAQ